MAASAPGEHEPRSILKELVVNQYQAILLGGAALASLVSLNPLPLLVWLGGELVTLPLLDSRPLRLYVHRRRMKRARSEVEGRRARVIAAIGPASQRRYREMEHLSRQIEANYQGLHGLSQAYLTEQRDKLDVILDGYVHRLMAIERYERLLRNRDAAEIEATIGRLEDELQDPELTERARLAIAKNIELKRKLVTSFADAGDTIKALSTELDSMASLLEVLHQNSVSMRDPHTLSQELDSIVRQSEDSERVVREMEALLRSESSEWNIGPEVPPLADSGPPPLPDHVREQARAERRRTRQR